MGLAQETGSIYDLTPDPNNANKGTERGAKLVSSSIQSLKFGRSVLTDKNGTLIAGNKTTAAAQALGLEQTLVVRTDGDTLVVVQRDDLDLSAPTSSAAYQQARELSIADNQSAFVGLDWSAPVIEEYQGEGVDLDNWFMPSELDTILNGLEEPDLPDDLGEDFEGDRDKEIECVCPKCGEKFLRKL